MDERTNELIDNCNGIKLFLIGLYTKKSIARSHNFIIHFPCVFFLLFIITVSTHFLMNFQELIASFTFSLSLTLTLCHINDKTKVIFMFTHFILHFFFPFFFLLHSLFNSHFMLLPFLIVGVVIVINIVFTALMVVVCVVFFSHSKFLIYYTNSVDNYIVCAPLPNPLIALYLQIHRCQLVFYK